MRTHGYRESGMGQVLRRTQVLTSLVHEGTQYKQWESVCSLGFLLNLKIEDN